MKVFLSIINKIRETKTAKMPETLFYHTNKQHNGTLCEKMLIYQRKKTHFFKLFSISISLNLNYFALISVRFQLTLTLQAESNLECLRVEYSWPFRTINRYSSNGKGFSKKIYNLFWENFIFFFNWNWYKFDVKLLEYVIFSIEEWEGF